MSWPIKYTYNHETLIIENDACLSPMLISGGRGQCSSDASIGVGYSHSASARHASDEAEELNEEVNNFLILLNHTSCSYASTKLWTWAGCPTLMFGSQSRVLSALQPKVIPYLLANTAARIHSICADTWHFGQ